MDREYAYKLGQAFKLGMIYARGKAHRKIVTDSKLTKDKAEWITVHPNGKENKGRPALIDSTTGQVLGGMGGKFNGQHISIANSKSNKPALLNNQKMGFYDVEKEQEKTTTQYNAMQSKANLNMNEIISNSYIREDVTKGDTDQLRTTIESIENGENNTKIVTPKNIYEFKDNKWTDKDGNTVNKTLDSVIMEDFSEFNKSSKYGSEEVKAKAESDTLLSSGRTLDPKLAEKLDKKKEQAQEIQKELDKSSGRTHSQRMGDTTRRNKLNKINNEIKEIETQLKDKAKQSKTNQPAKNQPLNNSFRDRLKEVLSKTSDFSKIDDESVKNLPYQMLHEKALQVSKESRELGNFENQLRKEKEESAKTQNRADTEQEHRDYNGALIDLQDRQKKLDYYSRVLNQEMKKRENNKTDNANLSDKAKKFYENQLNNKQTNTNPISLNDLSDPQKVADYNKNVTKIVNKQLKDGGGLDKGDFTNIVNSMTDNEEVKKNALRGVNTSKDLSSWERNRENDYWAKYPENISLKNYEERGFDFSVPELNIGVWTKPQDLTPEQRKGMQEYFYKEYTKDKIRRLKLSKEDVKRLSQNNTTTANKTLQANKDNGSVASVLNVPDASKWNNKIYKYGNGDRAVFINNQKIILNDDQYNQLRKLAGK